MTIVPPTFSPAPWFGPVAAFLGTLGLAYGGVRLIVIFGLIFPPEA